MTECKQEGGAGAGTPLPSKDGHTQGGVRFLLYAQPRAEEVAAKAAHGARGE